MLNSHNLTYLIKYISQDGGVFTCGAGMYGQLGHGANSNEMLPRQIIELMGSVVTQVNINQKLILFFKC